MGTRECVSNKEEDKDDEMPSRRINNRDSYTF